MYSTHYYIENIQIECQWKRERKRVTEEGWKACFLSENFRYIHVFHFFSFHFIFCFERNYRMKCLKKKVNNEGNKRSGGDKEKHTSRTHRHRDILSISWNIYRSIYRMWKLFQRIGFCLHASYVCTMLCARGSSSESLSHSLCVCVLFNL